MKFISYCNRIISSGFYSLFLLVPLIFTGNTSELFEFNKMWLTFGITIIITAAWICKMIAQRSISIKRTPLDIPLLLFLCSQIISTIFSLDTHVSIWGYYSRFNGGLLSTITYIILYYALVTNLSAKQVLRSLTVTLFSGFLVGLWGFPSHFGYDPTCLVFRGTLDTSCWTDAFKPTIRTFSTLGQPAWFAAYLGIITPLTIAYFLKNQELQIKNQGKRKILLLTSYFLLLSIFSYLNLIFANTRAGLIAFIIANIIFWLLVFIRKIFDTKSFIKYATIFNVSFLLCNFLFGGPIGPLEKFTLPQLKTHFVAKANATSTTTPPSTTPHPLPPTPSFNITDSGQIRLLVWHGAIDAWRAHPIFGTGVETFAFAYYQYRPKAHNLTSEWDYLYNKAHNEYLNYLATTGIFGLGSYLAIIGFFIYQFFKYLLSSKTETSTKQTSNSSINHYPLPTTSFYLINIALFTGYLTILISNFFGFSVVIINIYFFLIPAITFTLGNLLGPKYLTFPIMHSTKTKSSTPYSLPPTHYVRIHPMQWTLIIITICLSGYFILGLFQYWYADTAYALGSNLDKVGSYQQAYPQLTQAVNIEPSEPVFKDELAVNLATLATALIAQKDSSDGAQFAQNAVALNDQIITNHPNDVIFWKDRVRIFYSLAQVDPTQQQAYLTEALKAMQKASQLAPTDAKISYNLGVLYGQTGNLQKGIDTIKQTIDLKPDYRDAYFALGLFYHELAIDKNNKVINKSQQEHAVQTMQYILDHLAPTDKQAQDTLKSWNK